MGRRRGADVRRSARAGGTATNHVNTSEFTYAKWSAGGSRVTFEHYTPLSGSAGCDAVWLTGGGTLFAAGNLVTAATHGIHLASVAPVPHDWVRNTTDWGQCTSLAASADGVCVAGVIGDQMMLWTYEP